MTKLNKEFFKDNERYNYLKNKDVKSMDNHDVEYMVYYMHINFPIFKDLNHSQTILIIQLMKKFQEIKIASYMKSFEAEKENDEEYEQYLKNGGNI
jgi:hypothetical protein